MSEPKITDEKEIAMVGVFSSLHLRSNGMHLNKLDQDFVEKVSTASLYQLADEGWRNSGRVTYVSPLMPNTFGSVKGSRTTSSGFDPHSKDQELG